MHSCACVHTHSHTNSLWDKVISCYPLLHEFKWLRVWNKTGTSSLKPDTTLSCSCSRAEEVVSPKIKTTLSDMCAIFCMQDVIQLCDEASCCTENEKKRSGQTEETSKTWEVLGQLLYPCLCGWTSHINRKRTNCFCNCTLLQYFWWKSDWLLAECYIRTLEDTVT